MKKILTFSILIFTGTLQADKINELKIMDQVDHLYRSKNSFADVEMLVKNPNYERTLKLKVWSEEMKNTLVEVVFPNKEKGTKTLKKDKAVWNYLPKVDKVVSIPPSMMMSNWMGSDLTNDDLVKQTTLTGQYIGKFTTCNSQNKKEVCIELKPKEKNISVWGKIILIVSKTDFFPLRQEFYNESLSLIRTFHYLDRKKIQGRDIPTTLRVTIEKNKSQETVLTYKNIDFNASLDSNVFSESELRKK